MEPFLRIQLAETDGTSRFEVDVDVLEVERNDWNSGR
jgi:hypothetical protein